MKKLLLPILAAALAACSSGSGREAEPGPAPGSCRPGLNGITVMLGSLPQSSLSDAFVYISGQQIYMPVYDTVFKTDNNYRIGSRILKSWVSSDDFTRYGFTLNEGLVFNNGKQLTSRALAAMLDPRGRSLYASDSVRRLVRSVRVIDGRSVEVLLKRPYSKFPSLLSDFKNVVVHEDEIRTQWPSGSGPFEICHKSSDTVVLQRRRLSAEDPGEVQQIRYVIPSGRQVDSEYLKRNRISFFPFMAVSDIEKIAGEYSKYRFLSQRVKALILNIPDRAARKALATCLDREAIMRHPFLSDSSYKYDFMLVNGVEDFSSGTPLSEPCSPYPGGKPAGPFSFLSFYDLPGSQEFMESYLKDWGRRANVSLRMETVQTSEIPGRLSGKKYDTAIIGIGPKSPLAEGLFLEFAYGGSERSVIGYRSELMDRAYERYVSAGPSESLGALREAERAIRADYLAVPLATQTITFYIPKGWANLTQSTSLTGVFDLTHLSVPPGGKGLFK